MSKLAMTSIVICLGIAAGGSTFAAETDAPLARAAVIAERDAALAAGLINAMNGEDSGSFHLSRQVWTATRSGDEVTAEMLKARESGELAAFIGEDSGSAFLAHVPRQLATHYAGPGRDEVPAVHVALAGAAR